MMHLMSKKFIIISILPILLASGCALKPTDIKNTQEVRFLDAQLDFFYEDLKKYNIGCVIHSVSSPSKSIPSGMIRSVAETLKNDNYMYLLISSSDANSEDLLYSLYYQYTQFGHMNTLKTDATRVKNDLLPPYKNICGQNGMLYMTNSKIEHISQYKHKDEGITAILYITKYAFPKRQPYFTPKNRRTPPPGRASSYLKENMK